MVDRLHVRCAQSPNGCQHSGFNANYTDDAAGNRTSAGGVTYTYDSGGRLISASDGTTYAYDAAGRLTSRTQSGQTTSFTGTRAIIWCVSTIRIAPTAPINMMRLAGASANVCQTAR